MDVGVGVDVCVGVGVGLGAGVGSDGVGVGSGAVGCVCVGARARAVCLHVYMHVHVPKFAKKSCRGARSATLPRSHWFCYFPAIGCNVPEASKYVNVIKESLTPYLE